MSMIEVSPATIQGCAFAPPSKSAAHRALICAALAKGGSVHGVILSDDMKATLNAVSPLGVKAVYKDGMVRIEAAPLLKTNPVIDCMESGSTLRFLIPIYAALGINCTFTGSGRLPLRPLDVYAWCLPENGVELETSGGLPLTVKGRLRSGRFEVPGDVSSQFISGLMFALPLCEGDSEIVLTSPLQSKSYVGLTIDSLKRAGINIHPTSCGWCVSGGQSYSPHDYKVEGDWSQAAFLLAMGALGGQITLKGMNNQSLQGDRVVLDLIKRMGADIRIRDDGITCRKSRLYGIDVDASQIPDLVPVLATLGAFASGRTKITGASRLRLKESDRLQAVSHCLNLLGGKVEQTADGLIVEGADSLRGKVNISCFGDHRIVMSMAVAALVCDNPITITDADSVNKSWPSFFEDYKNCGGVVNVIRDWNAS